MKNKLSSPSKGSKKIKTDIRSFFAPQPQSKNLNGMNWEFKHNNSLLIGINKETPKFNKVAAFDMDGTLITVNGKHVHPKNEFDWVWLYPNVTKTLQEYYTEKEYSIVIISNQGGLEPDKKNGETRTRQIKQKLSMMAKELDIPFIFLASVRKDIYRKPRTGMWDHLTKLIPNLDKENSFYVGDASGRQDNWKPGVKADHADTDRKFSLNLGIKFQVPEEFFQDHDPISYTLKGFCPFSFQKTRSSLETNIDELLQPIFDSQPNMVMLIGLPGSGKSSIVENYFESKDYISINQDTLKTKNKCVKACEANFEKGNSVIIDNTNTTKSSRATYLNIAKRSNVKCYAILINPDLDLSIHNGNVRSLLPNSDHAEVPKFVIKMQHDKYEAPTEAEGFEQIIQIPFIPKFKNEYHEQIWNSYTY